MSAPSEIQEKVDQFLASNDFKALPRHEFLKARFDAGLAIVHHPEDLGGLSLREEDQELVDRCFEQAGAPDNDPMSININIGQAIPAIRFAGTADQKKRFFKPLWTGETVCCQLFSEPEAGSDLASVRTRAERVDGGWKVTGQKIWTSLAHKADLAILLARTSSEPKAYSGLTYFLIDMRQAGIEVRPLRQITGEAEFNEVFLTDAFVPDDYVLGGVGGGWKVAMSTLETERAFYESRKLPRELGMVGELSREWRRMRNGRLDAAFGDQVASAWCEAEIARIANLRLAQRLLAGGNPSEAAGSKIRFAEINQKLSWLRLEIGGGAVGRAADYTYTRPERTEFIGDSPVYAYLRSRANSIEGGTTEILKNIIADRILELPRS